MHHMVCQQQVYMVNHLDDSQVLNFGGHQKNVGKQKSIMEVSMMQILKLKALLKLILQQSTVTTV